MTTELNIFEEELLADCVRKYPIIYIRSNVSRDDVEGAWALVVDQLDFLGRIGEAKRFWYNLRKKYTKRLLAYNNFSMTGNNEGDPAMEALLEPYSFMRWMDEYMDNGSSKDYSTLSSDTPITSPETDRKFQPCVNEGDASYNDPCCRSKSLEIVQAEGKGIAPKQLSNGSNRPPVEISYSKSFANRKESVHGAENDSRKVKTKADELYGQMIAEELANFNEIEKCSIKLEIRKILFEKLLSKKTFNTVVTQNDVTLSLERTNDPGKSDTIINVSEPDGDMRSSTVIMDQADVELDITGVHSQAKNTNGITLLSNDTKETKDKRMDISRGCARENNDQQSFIDDQRSLGK